MTTPANADGKATTSTTTKANNSNSGSNDDVGTVRVRLLARSWQRRVPGTDPIEYRRYQNGAEFDITQEEWDVLSSPEQFKPTVEKVEKAD